MIQVPEWGTNKTRPYEIVDDMENQIAIVFNETNARLIRQLPNMVMMLQRVVADYDRMLVRPEDSHIYTDIMEVLEDAEYKEEPTH